MRVVETPFSASVDADACIAGQDCALRTDVCIAFVRHCAVQAHGESVTFLGFTVPDVFRSFASSQRTIKEIHEWMEDAIMVVAGLHATAALWHHFILRYGTLLRMLGQRKASAPE